MLETFAVYQSAEYAFTNQTVLVYGVDPTVQFLAYVFGRRSLVSDARAAMTLSPSRTGSNIGVSSQESAWEMSIQVKSRLRFVR